MTTEPTNNIPEPAPIPTSKLLDKQVTILEDIFQLGYAKSNDLKVYEDDKGIEIVVQYRTLTACELRDIAESLGSFRSMAAQVWTEKIEVLSRAIVHINKMPLVLDQKERADFEAMKKRVPTSLEQAQIILYDKIKSPYIIDFLFEKYQEFIEKVAESFQDIKKKLNSQPSSV